MSTITPKQKAAIADLLKDCHLTRGLGEDKHRACSIAAINLALTGRLCDEPIECMSPVVAKWIIGVQDAMPEALRNSAEWRQLLPHAAGTGRELESERLALIMDWMWGTALPIAQPLADAHGFGHEWRNMCERRTANAANAANAAARAAARAAAAAYADANAAAAAYADAYSAANAVAAAYADANAAYADAYSAYADAYSADAAAYAASAAIYAVRTVAAADAAAWAKLDPVGLLRRLIDATPSA